MPSNLSARSAAPSEAHTEMAFEGIVGAVVTDLAGVRKADRDGRAHGAIEIGLAHEGVAVDGDAGDREGAEGASEALRH